MTDTVTRFPGITYRATRFERRLKVILRHEGGYVWDSRDPGGETNMGISKRAYPALDIKNLTTDEVAAIYRADYWDKCKCDELPEGVDLVVFDIAVNQGTKRAGRCLQRALCIKADGIIGPKTIGAVNRHKAVYALVREITARRLKKYGETRNFDRFGLGWCRRALDVLDIALALAKPPKTVVNLYED